MSTPPTKLMKKRPAPSQEALSAKNNNIAAESQDNIMALDSDKNKPNTAKKSKWRMSNPFSSSSSSKNRDSGYTTGTGVTTEPSNPSLKPQAAGADSAYGSEPNTSQSDMGANDRSHSSLQHSPRQQQQQRPPMPAQRETSSYDPPAEQGPAQSQAVATSQSQADVPEQESDSNEKQQQNKVVTKTTTTTTTETFTYGPNGETRTDVGEAPANGSGSPDKLAPPPTLSQTSTTPTLEREHSANSSNPSTEASGPPIPSRNEARRSQQLESSPSQAHRQSQPPAQPQSQPVELAVPSPQPPKNPESAPPGPFGPGPGRPSHNQNSYTGPHIPVPPSPISPVEPAKSPNFSYPARTPWQRPQSQQFAGQYTAYQPQPGQPPPLPQQQQQQQQQQGSTPNRVGSRSALSDLKSAAANVHGIGESLRGNLSASIDSRFGGSEQSMAQHHAAVERGRREMATGGFGYGHGQAQGQGQGQGQGQPVQPVQQQPQTQTQEPQAPPPQKKKGLSGIAEKLRN